MWQRCTLRPVSGFILVAAFGLALTWLARPVSLPTANAADRLEEYPALRGQTPGLKWLGVGSCASTPCHGGAPNRKDPVRSAYTVWSKEDDAHNGAFSALYNDRSRLIEKNFRHLPKLADADQDAVCLNCHAMNVPRNLIGSEKFSPEEGVGCELCHGAAEKWKEPHDKAGWRDKDEADKIALGRRPTKNLRARAQICADCHVGSPGRNVSHDLIAAGHPRLNFEYASFLGRINKHWSEAKDRERNADFEGRVWLMGQLAAAKAALDLLEWRAKSAEQVWPEFAEYDCFACHHQLTTPENSWRQKRGYGNQAAGTLPWGTWYLTLPRALAAQPGIGDAKLVTSLKELQQDMSKPYPDRKKVAVRARATADQLGEWLAKLEKDTYPKAEFRKLVIPLADDPAIAESSWDTTKQLHLALSSLRDALADAELNDASKKMGLKLKFPDKYDSPRDFNPKLLTEQLGDIRKLLGK